MLVDIWAPLPDGRMVRSYATIANVRRIHADAHIVASFSLEIVRLGTLYECRLWQYRAGDGFFVKGQSVLTAGEERYRSFIEFRGVFATVLERAVRQELVGNLNEEFGCLPMDDEFLALHRAERDEVVELPKPSFEDAILIEPVRSRPLHGSFLTFDATVGCGITFKGLRLSGSRTDPRLLPPTSSGLSFRPYLLEEPLKYEIVRRAARFLQTPPPGPSSDALAG